MILTFDFVELKVSDYQKPVSNHPDKHKPPPVLPEGKRTWRVKGEEWSDALWMASLPLGGEGGGLFFEKNHNLLWFLFGLSTENAYICIAFRGKSSLTWTLLQHDANTTPPRHKHFSTFTILLHRFCCFCAPTESQWVNKFTQIFTKVFFTPYLGNFFLFNLLKSFQSLWTSQK